MFTTAIYGEKLVKVINYNDITMELVQVPATIWCGSIAYAPNLTDEPDIPVLLQKYQSLCSIPKEDRATPDWSCCISIDYWQNGAVPRGMMFAQQVLTDKQDPAHDIYTMPESLYIRAAGTKAVAQAAFGRDECELWELFGVIKEAMEAEGYVISTNGAQEIELSDHTKYGMEDRPCFAYVQVEKKKTEEQMKQIDIVPFPYSAESNGFIAALASAVLPCLGITAETPYWCCHKGSHCIKCSGCDTLQKHQEMLYHTLLTASGMAFTFDYPEDDDVECHSMPGIPIGWRWEEPFVADLMDFAGLSYARYTDKTAAEMAPILKAAIDAGFTALCANHGVWQEMEWTRCWNVVCGYTNEGVRVMHHGGEIVTEAEETYQDWIVITGKAERKQTYKDVLERIYRILSDPSHDALEQEIYNDLSNVTPENAVGLSFKMMGINGVPIETRWHAAKAFCSCDNLLSSMTDDNTIKSKLSDLFFSRYTAENNNETHGIGWKIWGALNVGPNTGYMPTEESFALIQRPEVQEELKRLYRIVFDNDRAVAEGIYDIQKGI